MVHLRNWPSVRRDNKGKTFRKELDSPCKNKNRLRSGSLVEPAVVLPSPTSCTRTQCASGNVFPLKMPSIIGRALTTGCTRLCADPLGKRFLGFWFPLGGLLDPVDRHPRGKLRTPTLGNGHSPWSCCPFAYFLHKQHHHRAPMRPVRVLPCVGIWKKIIFSKISYSAKDTGTRQQQTQRQRKPKDTPARLPMLLNIAA